MGCQTAPGVVYAAVTLREQSAFGGRHLCQPCKREEVCSADVHMRATFYYAVLKCEPPSTVLSLQAPSEQQSQSQARALAFCRQLRRRQEVRWRHQGLGAAKAAAAAEALTADAQQQGVKDVKAKATLARRILGNQAAALKGVAQALQVRTICSDRRVCPDYQDKQCLPDSC